MELIWKICDRNGLPIANLLDRHSGRVTIGRNAARTASVIGALDDPAALSVLPLGCQLRVWINGTEAPIFAGRITSPRFADDAGAGEGGASVTVVAIDPFFSLERAFTRGFPIQTAVDQSEIAWALIDHVGGGMGGWEDVKHGIIRGDLPVTVARDRTYVDGEQIAEKITQLSEVLAGMDFELEPLDRRDGVIAAFNTFAHQGITRPNAIFEYGHNRHNVSGFTYEPAGEEVCNKFTAVGQADANGIALAYTAESAKSQAFYGGTFEQFQVYSDVIDGFTLASTANEAVRRNAYALDFFQLTTPPERGSEGFENPAKGAQFGVPPAFGEDYGIGDTITARIKRNVYFEAIGRVESVELSEDDQGAVTVTTTCVPEAVLADDITGALASINFGVEA